uniref:Inositol polyphosphate-4-phosphatase type II B n=1 Tax=Mastacembelus armatus TaxID=205130 RepID=A0A3Q3LBL6_9TELE
MPSSCGNFTLWEFWLSSKACSAPSVRTHTHTHTHTHTLTWCTHCMWMYMVCMCVSGDEAGMLEDMEVGVTDLSEVPQHSICLSPCRGGLVVEVPLPLENFRSLPQELQNKSLIRVHPVLFNIGINQQQSLAERFGDSSLQGRVNRQSCERLKAYSPKCVCSSTQEQQRHQSLSLDCLTVQVCRQVNGVRLTSCKSAKDRTAMSVTLEQCVLLRERHTLSQQHFSTALDCMRRDGCRLENVQKNVGSRKFADTDFSLCTDFFYIVGLLVL